MNPGQIVGATRVLGPPADWDAKKNGECDSLYIRHVRIGTHDCIESAWVPTEEERTLIAQGRPIILTVWGKVHPPVSINVQP